MEEEEESFYICLQEYDQESEHWDLVTRKSNSDKTISQPEFIDHFLQRSVIRKIDFRDANKSQTDQESINNDLEDNWASPDKFKIAL